MFHFRKSGRFGPLRVTATERGVTWGLRAGRWSWNPKTRRHSVDLPGPVNWRSSTRRRSSAAPTRRSPILGLFGLLVVLAVGYLWLIGALPS